LFIPYSIQEFRIELEVKKTMASWLIEFHSGVKRKMKKKIMRESGRGIS
jgi:hypothetical protein